MNELVPLYREMVESGDNFQGLAILQHCIEVGVLIQRIGASTLLDFGSGRGKAYLPPYEIHKGWGTEAPQLYDPAFATHDVLPADGVQFDMVICSDVLEHVPEHDVPAFIDELFSLASKHVWASVCCRPAKKRFADGRNMHVTVRPMSWWREQFENVAARHGIGWTLKESP